MQNVEGCAGWIGTELHARETGLMDTITYVGSDVHKPAPARRRATVCVALAESGRGGELRQLGVFENRPAILMKLAARLSKGGRRLSFCYEAGPCGYGLHRLLTGCGHDCVVLAPSLIPLKAGDRVKTDRRDAVMLAKLHRAGELTPIWIPDAAHEAMSDLVRARATEGGYYRRRASICKASCCATTRSIEGFVPGRWPISSEHSSGASVRRGGITKAGNALARRVLIEGAWTYRMPARQP
jgi:transposase